MKKLFHVFTFIFMLLLFTSCGKTDSSSSLNSVDIYEDAGDNNNMISNPGVFLKLNGESEFVGVADPFCLRGDDGYYYLYSTQLDCTRGEKGYGFDPGPIFKSRNMQSWEYCVSVFLDTPNYQQYIGWNNGEGGVWAPSVVKLNNQYVFYYTLGAGGYYSGYTGIGVASSPTPYGPWTHYGKLFDSQEIGVKNSIDCYVFNEEEHVWCVWGSGDGIWIMELSEDGLSLKGGLERQNQNKVQIAGFNLFYNDNYEASFIQKKNGYYYLYLSTGACCAGVKSDYHVVVGRSKTIYGPYLGENGRAIDAPNRGSTVIQAHLKKGMGPGHCAIVQDDKGLDWIVYHAYNPNASNSVEQNTRTLYVDRIYWNEKGFPICKDTYPNFGEIPGPYIYQKEE